MYFTIFTLPTCDSRFTNYAISLYDSSYFYYLTPPTLINMHAFIVDCSSVADSVLHCGWDLSDWRHHVPPVVQRGETTMGRDTRRIRTSCQPKGGGESGVSGRWGGESGEGGGDSGKGVVMWQIEKENWAKTKRNTEGIQDRKIYLTSQSFKGWEGSIMFLRRRSLIYSGWSNKDRNKIEKKERNP